MTRWLWPALIAFAGIEAFLFWRSITLFGWKGTLAHLTIYVEDPLVFMMLVDFTFFAAAVLIWMILDARSRGKIGWFLFFLPFFLLFPTAGLFGYLLMTRRG